MDRQAEQERQRALQEELRIKLEGSKTPDPNKALEMVRLMERTSWGVELALSLAVTTTLRLDDLTERMEALEQRVEDL